jgi:hypothetical protein
MLRLTGRQIKYCGDKNGTLIFPNIAEWRDHDLTTRPGGSCGLRRGLSEGGADFGMRSGQGVSGMGVGLGRETNSSLFRAPVHY